MKSVILTPQEIVIVWLITLQPALRVEPKPLIWQAPFKPRPLLGLYLEGLESGHLLGGRFSFMNETMKKLSGMLQTQGVGANPLTEDLNLSNPSCHQ